MRDFDQWLKRYNARTGIFRRTPSNPFSKVNKKRKLRYGSISIPLNNARAYWDAKKAFQIFVVSPLDYTAMQFALEEGLLNKVVFGRRFNAVIEGILLDDETGVPWQIPKVTVDYRQIDYTTVKRSDSQLDVTKIEEVPLSPKSVTTEPTAVEEPFEQRPELKA